MVWDATLVSCAIAHRVAVTRNKDRNSFFIVDNHFVRLSDKIDKKINGQDANGRHLASVASIGILGFLTWVGLTRRVTSSW